MISSVLADAVIEGKQGEQFAPAPAESEVQTEESAEEAEESESTEG